MEKKKLPRGIKKHIRREKTRIRKEILDKKEQQEKIDEVYKKIFKDHED